MTADGPSPATARHIEQAEADARIVPGLSDAVLRPIRTTGVIGAGTMGTGIAVALLAAGLPVTLVEREQAPLDRAQDAIRKIIDGNVASGRMSEAAGSAALAALTLTTDIGDLAPVDLVVEAAFETMEVKRDVFGRLDAIARPGAILATNTSYLDVAQIAAATRRPADVIGLHFFSPAHIMKLLEIVRTDATGADVIATAIDLAGRMGKKPVVAGNAFGFIGNRMLRVRRDEAEAIILEGVTPDRVDRIVEAFGFRMGPFRTSDLAGLDLGWSPETSRGATVRERLCEAGRRGQKTGKGFYDYDDARQASASPEALAIIHDYAQDRGIAAQAWTDAAILDRMLLPMIDEGARIVAEGIAQRPSDIDVVWLHGYGWPRRTGGPMHYAQQIGADALAARFAAIGRTPSDALMTLTGTVPAAGERQLEAKAL
ncbi:3-hydroxyacyl-CoA dehydrogenase [Sphingomonas sp. 2SG]|uniref:3-hydroxyacyl-CoA dehydrogenase n=1 Tax=Sphingomonas sp. 2SG TaxID=2502201 RepID=UPI0010FA00F1|nr:3-hydroxyacyl-CoA dehydrogenase [Sphingomonas sp. 2SG]